MDQQNLQQNPLNEMPPQVAPQESTTPPPVPPSQPLPEPPTTGRDKKKILLIVGVFLLLILLACAAFYLTRNGTAKNPDQDTDNNSQEITTTPVVPDRLVYAQGNGNETPVVLYSKPATVDGSPTVAITLPKGHQIQDSVVRKNQVAFSTTVEYGGTEGAAIYYSADSGKSYKKIYSTPQKSDGVAMEDQITSIAFSTDGKAVAAAILPEDAPRLAGTENNKVTEISLEESSPNRTLFTTEEAGVFLKAYDRSAQKVIFTAGCYNCDGGPSNDVFFYDIAAKKRETIYSSENPILSSAVKDDMTHLLVLEGTWNRNSQDPYDTIISPYTLFEINVDTRVKETLASVNDKWRNDAGYTIDGMPYISTNERIIKIVDKAQNTIFETSGSISYTHNGFIGADTFITSYSKSIEDTTTSIVRSQPGNTSPTEILNVDTNTKFIGVTY